jgi:hypothetical protein
MKNTPLISVCIPIWGIQGKGIDYLEYSFNILAQQTFKDFEVVLSDHSEDNYLEIYVDNWKEYLNIVYVKCNEGRGIISPNLNNAIRHCNGEYIKILFQDDFLYDENSLQIVADYLSKKEIKWLLTGCTHTTDMITIYKSMIPFYHDRIYEGINTISCPSVLTIKNDNDKLSFNEELKWIMDVEYYKRCYDKFGEPDIIPSVCIVNREGNIVRASNLIDDETKNSEVKLMIEKYRL